MFEHERELTEKNKEHLRDMGYASDRDLSKMRELVFGSAGGALKNQARQFLAAAKSNESLSVAFTLRGGRKRSTRTRPERWLLRTLPQQGKTRSRTSWTRTSPRTSTRSSSS